MENKKASLGDGFFILDNSGNQRYKHKKSGSYLYGRVEGIEPSLLGPQPSVLPLNDTRHEIIIVFEIAESKYFENVFCARRGNRTRYPNALLGITE